MAVPTALRYSPFNWLIVPWSFNGQRFADCGLPSPAPCEEPTEDSPAPCRALPIQEAIDTYDGEVMVNLKQKCTQHTIDNTFGPSPARALLLATLRAVKGGADAA